MWVLAVILIVALLIPVAAILVDSPLGKSVARRMEGRVEGGPTPEVRDMQRRVELMETEIEDLNRSIAGTDVWSSTPISVVVIVKSA